MPPIPTTQTSNTEGRNATMAKKTKFFRVATSGATTDGRTIKPQDLIDMAATYDPATYQARVNLDHITTVYPGSTFRPHGDVLALETRPVTLNVGGKPEERTGLYAQINALDPLIALHENSEKLFTSIQVRPNFAGTGKAYLDGLAFTDNPASLGTEVMKFCAGLNAAGTPEASPLHFRKLNADSFFTAAEEATLEFDADGDVDAAGENPFMAALRKCFEGFNAKAPVVEAVAAPTVDPKLAEALLHMSTISEQGFAKLFAATDTLTRTATKAAADLASVKAELAEVKAENATFKTALDGLPSAKFTARHRATGAESDELKTDC